MFLEIPQYWHKNTCVRVSSSIQASVQVFFCEFCEISKNRFFTEHLWATASEHSSALLFRYFPFFLLCYIKPNTSAFIFVKQRSTTVLQTGVSKYSNKSRWMIYLFTNYGNNHWCCSVQNDVLKNFTGFTEKYLCQSPLIENAIFTEYLRTTDTAIT